MIFLDSNMEVTDESRQREPTRTVCSMRNALVKATNSMLGGIEDMYPAQTCP